MFTILGGRETSCILSEPGVGGGLTRLLGAGVDGRGLRAGPGRVEGGHRQVVGAAGPQPADVDLREVARDANFAHGVGLGVVLPVHHLVAPQRAGDSFFFSREPGCSRTSGWKVLD